MLSDIEQEMVIYSQLAADTRFIDPNAMSCRSAGLEDDERQRQRKTESQRGKKDEDTEREKRDRPARDRQKDKQRMTETDTLRDRPTEESVER